MRKKIMLFMFFVLLANILIFIPASVEGLSAAPAKLIIKMPEGYPEGEIDYRITVHNPSSHGINVSARIANPSPDKKTENYSYIPDLSWVKTVPEIMYIPADSSRELGLSMDIPDTEKPLHYNERWEVWTIISEIQDQPSSKNTMIQVELAIKLFINTPSQAAKMQIPQNLYLILGITVGATVIAIAIRFVKKRKKEISIRTRR